MRGQRRLCHRDKVYSVTVTEHHGRLFGFLWACLLMMASVQAKQVVIPFGFMSPENGLGLGLRLIHKPSASRVERQDLQAYATSRLQFQGKWDIRSVGQASWQNATWRWRNEVEVFRFPESWFGEGNAPQKKDEHIFTPTGVTNRFALEAMPWKSFKVRSGFWLQGLVSEDWEKVDGDSVNQRIVPEAIFTRDSRISERWEIGLEWDARDDEDLPRRGYRVGMKGGYSIFSPVWSEPRHGAYEGFASGHLLPWPWLEGAGRFFHTQVLGDAPLMAWTPLGDRKVLRGLPRRMLRDRVSQALGVEVRPTWEMRLPFFDAWLGRIWQAAVFGDVGRVEQDMASIWRAQWHVTGGIGGRLILHERLGALRGDLGFSSQGMGLYIDFNQAF